ncbi:MAG: hypothetical protein ACP5JU_02835 [Minisyncoccia bacterium]
MRKSLLLFLTFFLLVSFIPVFAKKGQELKPPMPPLPNVASRNIDKNENTEDFNIDVKRTNEDEDIKDFSVRKGTNFFILNPANRASCGGVIQKYEGDLLTISSNGFITNWVVGTSTEIMPKDAKIEVNAQVRIIGNWDGGNLIAKRIIVYQAPKITPLQIQNILKFVERLNIKPEVKEMIKNLLLQQATTTETGGSPAETE